MSPGRLSDLTTARLAGLDVGFSSTRPSSGVALLTDGYARVSHHRYTDASTELLRAAPFACVAIDGPLVPDGLSASASRLVEQALASGSFARRCKAAFSHVPGTGRLLREHAGAAADRLIAAAPCATRCPAVRAASGVVEAFPNAYLGVCLPDDVYAAQPPLRRGRKFDWLYDRWLAAEHAELLERVGSPSGLTAAMRATRNHDARAAWVCLWTAYGVLAGRFVALGEPDGGWITLPPLDCWADWAQDALAAALRRLPRLQLVTG